MKKSIVVMLCIFIVNKLSAGDHASNDTFQNPLSVYSVQWNQPRFRPCNSAKDADYLTAEEKRVIWVLNMIRLDPRLFVKTVLLNPRYTFYQEPENRNYYYQSLLDDLNASQPITIFIQPDSLCYESAKCHACSSGASGYVGHQRISKSCKENYFGECCDYGFNDAVSILSHLLIDKDHPDFGHRKICLSGTFKTLGLSIQPHKIWKYTTVLDFKY